MDPIDRARRYVSAMEPSIAGSGGHDAAFAAAKALIRGFALTVDQARMVFCEDFNPRCQPPWSEREIEHKLRQAEKGSTDAREVGYLLGGAERSAAEGRPAFPSDRAPKVKAEFDAEQLRAFAAKWRDVVDLVWLANRSPVEPVNLSSSQFLALLYPRAPKEKILCFLNEFSQGEVMWPTEGDAPVDGEKKGAWFLPQPVDGSRHVYPDKPGYLSRRRAQSIIEYRYMVLESDEAPVRDWLGAVVQLPLRIAAIYSSGGKSVHALVRVDAPTYDAWQTVKAEMAPGLAFLVANGLDERVLSASRLTRLPGCTRNGKLQKLLYLAPNPTARPICEMPPKRDVEAVWEQLAEGGSGDADETGGEWLRHGLEFYAPVSARLRERLRKWTSKREN